MSEKKPVPVHLSVQRAYEGPIRMPADSTIRRWVKAAAMRPTTLAVRFVDTDEGYELNSTYRHKDYATNVLTFPYTTEPEVEADVVICIPVVECQAREQRKAYYHHLAHMLVHATLHAHGYDHETDEEAEEMEAIEKKVMASLHCPDPYQDAD